MDMNRAGEHGPKRSKLPLSELVQEKAKRENIEIKAGAARPGAMLSALIGRVFEKSGSRRPF